MQGPLGCGQNRTPLIHPILFGIGCLAPVATAIAANDPAATFAAPNIAIVTASIILVFDDVVDGKNSRWWWTRRHNLKHGQ